jgi:hypothetical protein
MKQFFRAAASLLLVLVFCTVAFVPLRATEHPSATPSVPQTPYAPGVVYVKMRSGSSAVQEYKHVGVVAQSAGASLFARVLDQLKATATVPFDADAPKDAITHDLGIDRMYVIYYSNKSIDAQKALAILIETGEVECGSVRYIFPLAYTPNDKYISQQYAVTNMQLKAAWDVTKGDSNILIADVDDGFNTKHEDLKNAIKIGHDVVGNVGAGEQFQPDEDPTPDNSANTHGSHTAGCIAATGNNGLGIVGSGFGCRLIAIKATGNDPNAGISGGYEGIHYAATHGARVINCSWGGQVSGDQTFANTFLIEAQQRNALMVASSGNGNQFGQPISNDVTPFYPCNGPGVLSVGATDQNDGPASFSNYGKTVSVWAPGVSILSCTYPATSGSSAYNAEDGTSFSSPLTAGVAGLVTSLHPDWPPHFIARQIINTVDNVVVPADRTEYWGRVNASSALSTAPQPGLLVTSYKIDGVDNDSLRGSGNNHTLTLTFKNVTASGNNIQAKLISATGYSTNSTPATLGSVALGATVSADLQIARTATYSEGTIQVQCELFNGADYDDIVTVNIPLAKQPGFVVEQTVISGSSVKRVSHSAAWAAFGTENQTTGIVTYADYARELGGVWSDTAKLDDRSQAPYCIDAWDSLTAWFGTGPKNDPASVIMTNDGGKTFSIADVSSFTPFVNSVHFFDAGSGAAPHEGIIIGDPASTSAISPYGIGRTLDGGKTWTHVSTAPKSSTTSSGFEASWNNSAAWVGDKGWYGTNNSKIWHTTNRGASWTSAATSFQHSFSIAFADDGLHGFACFRPAGAAGSTSTTGKAGMCVSSNGGVSWKSMKMPVTNMTPGVVTYIQGTNIAIVTSDSGVFRTTDYGTTWSPIGVPVSYGAGDAAHISAYSDSARFTVSMISSLSGVATYSEAFPAAVSNGSVLFDAAKLSLGAVVVGSSHALPVTITNTEKTSVTINNVKVTSASGAFQSVGFLNGTPLPVTIAANGMTRDTFSFVPSALGFDTAIATFTLTETDRTHDTTIMLVGQGVAPAAVNSQQEVSLSLTVSPNPAHGAMHVSLAVPAREHIRVAMFDAVGRQVVTLLDQEAEPGTVPVTFDASSLPAGTYYVVLTPERGQPITRAISIEK